MGKAEDDTWRKEMWTVINGLRSDISSVRESLANLNGRLVGYVLAGTILGGILAAVAQVLVTHLQK